MKKIKQEQERRSFIRLDRVFPVEFRLIDPENQNILTDWQQAFTDNVSKGGICFIINQPCMVVKELLEKMQPDFQFKIFIPFNQLPIQAKGKLKWIVKKKVDELDQYLIGIGYQEIHPQDNKKIIRYAYIKKLTPIFALSVIAILLASITFSFYFNVKLIKSNLGLAQDLFSIIHKSRKAKDTIKEIKKEKDDLDLRLSQLAIKNQNLIQKLEVVRAPKEKDFLEEELRKVDMSVTAIKQRVTDLYIKEAQITEDLLSVEKKKPKIQNKDIENMYAWLKSLQDTQSGQIKMNGVTNQDNFLACQLYSIFGDYDQARKILDFYFKNNQNKLNVQEEMDLVISALKYSYITKDVRYLELVEKMISQAIEAQLKGTENEKTQLKLYAVLDAYLKLKWNTTFNLYYRNLIQNLRLPYDSEGKFEYIMIFNLKKAQEIGITDVVTNLEDSLSCIKAYSSPSQPATQQIKGFTFSSSKNNLTTNFVEDTAKMILIYKLTAKFFENRNDIYRAKFYREKAFFYLNELANLINSSNSYKFMPYVDGQFLGQGAAGSTIYTIFAYYNYNPFGLDE